MGRKCCVCTDGRRDQIERALLSGTPLRKITENFGIKAGSLWRHRTDHLPTALVKAAASAEMARSDGLLQHVHTLVGRTESLFEDAQAILADAKAANDPRTVLAAIRECTGVVREQRAHLALIGQITGELEPRVIELTVEAIVQLPGARPSVNATVVDVKAMPEAK
jgi:hypothetical protein